MASANGVGKSTLTRRYLAGRLPIVNPDDIAPELDPTKPTRVRIRVWAGREAIRRQEAWLTRGAAFAMETTLAGNRDLALLRRARTAGYDVLLGRIAQRIMDQGSVHFREVNLSVAGLGCSAFVGCAAETGFRHHALGRRGCLAHITLGLVNDAGPLYLSSYGNT